MKRLILIGSLVSLLACTARDQGSPIRESRAATPAPPRAPNVLGGTDQSAQRKRKEIIDGLIKARVFWKIEREDADRTPMLWVGPAFAGLPFEDKENFVRVVLDYCVITNPQHDAIGLVDWRSGKLIGRMDAELGLSLE